MDLFVGAGDCFRKSPLYPCGHAVDFEGTGPVVR